MSSYMKRVHAGLRIKRELQYGEKGPMQIVCEICRCRKFYLMAQDDGSVESFCETNNHKQVLVNIPQLTSKIFEQVNGDLSQMSDEALHNILHNVLFIAQRRVSGESESTATTETGTEIVPSGTQQTNPSGPKHGASRRSDSFDLRRDS